MLSWEITLKNHFYFYYHNYYSPSYISGISRIPYRSSTRRRIFDLPSRAYLLMLLNCFPGISLRWFSKFNGIAPSYSSMIGITFKFVFHSFCIYTMMSWYFKFSSALSLAFQSRGTATSIIVVVIFVLSNTTTRCSPRAGITLSIRISKSLDAFTSLFSAVGSGWCLHGVLLVLIP